ncbi:MAG: AAA family ATPase [Coriobacteriales bacterium]
MANSTPREETNSRAYTEEDFLNEVFIEEQDLQKLKYLLQKKRNLILQGAPGTGKSFAARKLASLAVGRDTPGDPRVEFIQFHSQSSYENFIYGWRPNPNGGMHQRPGGFVRFCMRAHEDRSHQYAVIIDEINRADLGRVFGLVSMAMEAGHRDEYVSLPFDEYDDEGQPTGRDVRFCVPSNVSIIGIINTADKDLTRIDYALRRRFAFYTMRPAFRLVRGQLEMNARFASEVARFQREDGSNPLLDLVENVAMLNKEMAAAKQVYGNNFCIGHSYFCGLDHTNPEQALYEVREYELKPLIEEYCFHDLDTARRWTNILMRGTESSR